MHRSNFLLYLASSVAPRLAMFVVLFAMARIATKEETGLFVLLITAGEIFDSVLQYWCRTLFIRKQAAAGGPRPLQAGRLVVLTVAGLGLGLLGSAAAAALIAPGHEAAFALALGAYLCAYGIQRTALQIIQARHLHTAYCAVEIFRGLLLPIGALAPVLAGASVLPAAGLGMAASAAVAAVPALWIAWRSLGRLRFSSSGYREALGFGLPLIGTMLLTQLLGWGDRLILNEILGPASVAVYGLTFALARQPIELLSGPLNASTYPMLFRTYAAAGIDGAAGVVGAMIVTHVALSGAAALCIALMAEPIAAALLPSAYLPMAVNLMPSLAASGIIMALMTYTFDNLFAVANRNGLQLWSMVISGAIALPATIALIAGFGLPAAGYATLVGAVIGLAAAIALTRVFVVVPIPWTRLAQVVGAMGVAAVAMLAADAALVGLNPWIRLVVAGLSFAAIYLPLLALSGFRIQALVSAPWDVVGPRPTAAAAASGGPAR
jgi:O-antigen/teichoic acid export membrane protein